MTADCRTQALENPTAVLQQLHHTHTSSSNLPRLVADHFSKLFQSQNAFAKVISSRNVEMELYRDKRDPCRSLRSMCSTRQNLTLIVPSFVSVQWFKTHPFPQRCTSTSTATVPVADGECMEPMIRVAPVRVASTTPIFGSVMCSGPPPYLLSLTGAGPNWMVIILVRSMLLLNYLCLILREIVRSRPVSFRPGSIPETTQVPSSLTRAHRGANQGMSPSKRYGFSPTPHPALRARKRRDV